jgi:hypothetical protein
MCVHENDVGVLNSLLADVLVECLPPPFPLFLPQKAVVFTGYVLKGGRHKRVE